MKYKCVRWQPGDSPPDMCFWGEVVSTTVEEEEEVEEERNKPCYFVALMWHAGASCPCRCVCHCFCSSTAFTISRWTYQLRTEEPSCLVFLRFFLRDASETKLLFNVFLRRVRKKNKMDKSSRAARKRRCNRRVVFPPENCFLSLWSSPCWSFYLKSAVFW